MAISGAILGNSLHFILHGAWNPSKRAVARILRLRSLGRALAAPRAQGLSRGRWRRLAPYRSSDKPLRRMSIGAARGAVLSRLASVAALTSSAVVAQGQGWRRPGPGSHAPRRAGASDSVPFLAAQRGATRYFYRKEEHRYARAPPRLAYRRSCKPEDPPSQSPWRLAPSSTDGGSSGDLFRASQAGIGPIRCVWPPKLVELLMAHGGPHHASGTKSQPFEPHIQIFWVETLASSS